jgi:hypothetical protein
MHSIIMVALLPIPIKNCDIPQQLLAKQGHTNREVLNKVLRRVVQPLNFTQNSSVESRYYNVLCADGNFRHCKPVLAAWLADCPEYSHLRNLDQHVCFWCECSKNNVGVYVPPDKQHPRRNHHLYGTFSDANTMAADAEL